MSKKNMNKSLKQRIKKEKERIKDIIRKKERVQTRYLKFATDEQILDLKYDYIKNFNDNEYKKYMKRLAKIANQRVKDIKDSNMDSYAVNHYYEKGGVFGQKYKNRESMIKEVNRIKGFLNNKSSTLEGIESIKRKAEQTIFRNTGLNVNFSGNKFNRFMKIFNIFAEILPEEVLAAEYRKILEFVNNWTNNNVDIELILDKAQENAHSMYINYMKEKGNMTNIEKDIYNIIDEQLNERIKYGIY